MTEIGPQATARRERTTMERELAASEQALADAIMMVVKASPLD
jgi:hypothetical protein